MGPNAAWSDDLELPVQPVSVSMARDFARRLLVAHGMSHLTDDITLVVSELATNAMAHAATSFRVSLHAFEHALLLEVADGSQSEPSLLAAQLLDTNGRGMTIVNLLSRDWGVDAHPGGGKTVWAEFDLL